MSKKWAVVLLLLVGCGGGQSLRQAAPLPAPAVRAPSSPTTGGYAPAGMGLPGERLPNGDARPSLPRNRNSVKPAKGEPTIYAADDIRATGKAYPYEVGEAFVELRGDLKHLPRQCAAVMTEAIRKAFPGLDKRDVDATDGLCLDARLFEMCVANETRGRKDDVAAEAREAARKHVRQMCDNRKNDTSYVRRLVDGVRKSYEQ